MAVYYLVRPREGNNISTMEDGRGKCHNNVMGVDTCGGAAFILLNMK